MRRLPFFTMERVREGAEITNFKKSDLLNTFFLIEHCSKE